MGAMDDPTKALSSRRGWPAGLGVVLPQQELAALLIRMEVVLHTTSVKNRPIGADFCQLLLKEKPFVEPRGSCLQQERKDGRTKRCGHLNYLPGLKESFRLTLRLNTRCPGAQSLLSGQK